jgi:aryl-alcohol dehydrogenase-like predicted oxidoreductase
LRYRTLGGTGIDVSVQCLGTIMFGAIGNPDHDDRVRMIDVAVENGLNFIDTADMYGDGESEEIVGKVLVGRRESIVLATKGRLPDGRGSQPEWQLASVDHPGCRGKPQAAANGLD